MLPYALGRFVPVGLLGFLIAGLLAAFMSNFAATVNAAPPYFVNDIYKRYINPNASPKTYVRLSYLSFVCVVVIGVLIGWNVTSVNSGRGLDRLRTWGGYTASNVLKWYWWRFNGYGYFWGMVAGIGSALVMPQGRAAGAGLAASSGNLLHQYGSRHRLPAGAWNLIDRLLARDVAHQAGDDEVLMDFYRRVRPWGFWGPVLRKVLAEDPDFKRNKDFFRDMFNIAVGIVWQIALVALPLYIVIREWDRVAMAAGIDSGYFGDSQVHLVRPSGGARG